MLWDTRAFPGGGDDEPWLREPNYLRWIDPATGYRCVIARSALGHLCGYVRVPRGHPLHGAALLAHTVARLQVHGGVTSAGRLRGRRFKRGYWLGFDCGHYYDVVPVMEKTFPMASTLFAKFYPRRAYRTVQYVRTECAELAEQIAKRRTR